MGVQGLWDLLAPVGRRVSVETLAGKRLAIDASIWMIQFMKAMRDERGEMVSNAHLLGFFRRICKLLFLRTKPVFVFDGGTPVLKRRTVIARRRQREDAQAKVRKTAEKLLLNQLKKMRLKELAKELEDQKMKNDVKGKKVASSEADQAEKNEESTGDFNQEKMDEMLAASLAAEEDGMYDASASTSSDALYGHDRRASTSTGATTVDDVEYEDDEEMILPMTGGNVDPAVLAALPPSMQLDLLVQMRERLMAENRQKYQKVKKAPHRFSELQIESYLKTVAFRREIDQVQKAAAGKGVGGLQTARIASEANKEFIFSSSFTGDKHVLASAGMRKSSESQTQPEVQNSSSLPSTLVNAFTSGSVIASSGTEGPPSGDEVQRNLGNDVQTYRDDRGNIRVSRVRAMGIRMTRDLQRNLDMMKELEQDKMSEDVPVGSPNLSGMGTGNIKVVLEKSSEVTGGKSSSTETHVKSKAGADLETSLEISFEDDERCKPSDNDDDFFARLVAADFVPISSVGDKVSKDNSLESASEDEWEEGNVEVQLEHAKSTTNTSQAEPSNDNETELEWEDGTGDVYEGASSCPSGNMKPKSRGSVEEEAALQEAIRRSLDDLKSEADASQKVKESCEVAQLMSEGPLHQDKTGVAKNGSLNCSVSRTILVDVINQSKSLYTVDAPDIMATPSADDTGQNADMAVDGRCEKSKPSGAESPIEYGKNLLGEPAEVQINDAVETMKGPRNELPEVKCGSSQRTLDSGVGDFALGNPLHLTCNNTSQTSVGVPHTYGSHETPDSAVTVEESKNEPASSADINKTVGDEGSAQDVDGRQYHFGSKDDEFDNIQITGASLEDELQMLDEEYLVLGGEQRKMERNAASVNSEMFVECQELLQMFGIPYIIAPMEAEAQCAYMELAGLVEGVVTDDSDAFLFGAQSVYKNIFDDRKYVETYAMKDVESELGLTREKLIRMALLLGSDYTEGVSGIGIVNAIEVVNAFPEEDGLSKFREWIESPDPTILGTFGTKSGSSSKKRGSKFSGPSTNVSKNEMDSGTPLSEDCDENEGKELDDAPKMTQIFMDKHRNVSKNWHIPPSFPSQAVVSAYISPQVDKSTEPCSWGKPDLFALRRLSWEKFGWANQKADEVLIPVLKEYNKRETQLRMEAFYTFNEKFAKIRSKRISQAVKGITGKSIESCDDVKVGGNRSKRSNPETDDSIPGEENLANVSKEPRKNKARKVKPTSEKGQKMEYLQGKETMSHGIARASSRGRLKAQAGGKRKRKGTPDIEICDSDNVIDGHEMQFQKREAPDSLRRSSRSKKAAKYAESDEEVDQATHSLQEAAEEERFRDQNSDKNDSFWLNEMGHPTAADLALNDGLDGEYVVNGGGFCAEEDEQEKETGPLLDDGAPIEAGWKHPRVGGGFCPDEDEPEKETAPSLDDSASVEAYGNHLQTGGGFCVEEDEPGKETGLSQVDIDAEVGGDLHPQSAGGFCFDDHDTDKRSQTCALGETKGTQPEAGGNVGSLNAPRGGGFDRVVGVESSSCGSQHHLQADHDTPSGNVKGRAEMENATPAGSPMKALSAMPYLRRKKRRNL